MNNSYSDGSKRILILYIVPEDQDNEQEPNGFYMDAFNPTFLDIKKSFPLKGRYYFRFEIKLK